MAKAVHSSEAFESSEAISKGERKSFEGTDARTMKVQSEVAAENGERGGENFIM